MSFIPTFIWIALAGIWPILWHMGAGVLLMLGLLAAAWFSPVFKKTFLSLGIAVGAFLIGFTTGVVDGDRRVRAQWTAATTAALQQGDQARSGAVRDIKRKPAKWLRDHPDRYRRD